jgi:hypothetical protein
VKIPGNYIQSAPKNSQKRKKHYNPTTKSRKKAEKAKKNA